MFACLYAPGNHALLLRCAGYFSPLIEETANDTVVFDIRGLRRIHGTPEQIAAAIQARVGVPAQLAIAANPDAAVHAARGLRGTTILPAGGEAARLAPLPPYLLGGSPEFARHLDQWGIRNFGEFAALPALGVAARLGEEGTRLQKLARGEGQRQLRLREEPVFFREEKDLEHAVHLLEPLLFCLTQMVNDLCQRLRFHGRAANEIRLSLGLVRGAAHTARLRLPVPILDGKVLLKLLQLELGDRPPQAPVAKIEVELMPVESRTTQHGLFLPAAPEPEKLEVTLTRIRSLVGADKVGAPELLDTHRPDAYRLGALAAGKATPLPLRPKIGFRRFRPPFPARVWRNDLGRPAKIQSALGGGEVLVAAGPWQSSGDWWSSEVWTRQEWDVETQSLGVFRVYWDYGGGKWFIEGSYD